MYIFKICKNAYRKVKEYFYNPKKPKPQNHLEPELSNSKKHSWLNTILTLGFRPFKIAFFNSSYYIDAKNNHAGIEDLEKQNFWITTTTCATILRDYFFFRTWLGHEIVNSFISYYIKTNHPDFLKNKKENAILNNQTKLSLVVSCLLILLSESMSAEFNFVNITFKCLIYLSGIMTAYLTDYLIPKSKKNNILSFCAKNLGYAGGTWTMHQICRLTSAYLFFKLPKNSELTLTECIDKFRKLSPSQKQPCRNALINKLGLPKNTTHKIARKFIYNNLMRYHPNSNPFKNQHNHNRTVDFIGYLNILNSTRN